MVDVAFSFLYSFYVVMWTTEIVFACARSLARSLSLFPPSLSTEVIVRARSLARSFTLRNSLMSLVSLSFQPIFYEEEKKRKSMFISREIDRYKRGGK